jgi:site-specific DNA recombinase
MLDTSRPWISLSRLTEDRNHDKLGNDVQQKINKAWAKRMGISIAHWFNESNVSAADEHADRPLYEEALALLEEGSVGGIVVFKIDRLTRQMFEYERILRILRKTRAHIAESSTGITTDNYAGISLIRRSVESAESEIQNVKIRVEENKRERAYRGFYHGGSRRPFGFVGAKKDKHKRLKNSGKIGVKHIEPEIELLREAARRRLDGESYLDIIKDWHSRTPPVYGATGAPWNTKTLETVLTAPRMIARTVYRVTDPVTGIRKEKLRKAKWKPVLDETTWEQLRALRVTTQHKSANSAYALTGWLECGRCGHVLTGATRRYKKGDEIIGTMTYRCPSGTAYKAKGWCGRLSVLAEDVENLIAGRVLVRLAKTKNMISRVLDDDTPQTELIKVGEEIELCDRELERLAEAASEVESQKFSMTELLSYRKPFVDRRERAEARRRELVRMITLPTPQLRDYDDLSAWYEALSVGQKRELAMAHFKKVVVLPPGRSGRYFRPERVVFTPASPKELNGLVKKSLVGDFDGDAMSSELLVDH